MPRDHEKKSASVLRTSASMPYARPRRESRGEDGDRPVSARSTQGCFTCRIRRKKCPNTDGVGKCVTCVKLQVECLGYGKKRPVWMKIHARAIREVLRIPRTLRDPNDIRTLRTFYPPGWEPNYGLPTPPSSPDTEDQGVTAVLHVPLVGGPIPCFFRNPPPEFSVVPEDFWSLYLGLNAPSPLLLNPPTDDTYPASCDSTFGAGIYHANGNETILNRSGYCAELTSASYLPVQGCE